MHPGRTRRRSRPRPACRWTPTPPARTPRTASRTPRQHPRPPTDPPGRRCPRHGRRHLAHPPCPPGEAVGPRRQGPAPLAHRRTARDPPRVRDHPQPQADLEPRQVADKSGEITTFKSLLADLDLTGRTVTFDALHDHARYLVETKKAHYIALVKHNHPKLATFLRELPWADIPLRHRTRYSEYGRDEIRRLKAATVPKRLAFPHGVQALQTVRRRRDLQTGKVTLELLRPHRPHKIEAHHHVRDVTFAEDANRIRTGTAQGDVRLPQPRHRPGPLNRLGQDGRRHRPTTGPTPITHSTSSRPDHENARALQLLGWMVLVDAAATVSTVAAAVLQVAAQDRRTRGIIGMCCSWAVAHWHGRARKLALQPVQGGTEEAAAPASGADHPSQQVVASRASLTAQESQQCHEITRPPVG
jgi:predicted transposase YbfD/YdcC